MGKTVRKSVKDRLIAPVATGKPARRSRGTRVEVVTHSARLQSKAHSRGIHTEIHGRPGLETTATGQSKGSVSTPFLFGRAKNVPGQQLAQLRDAGVLR